MESVLEIVLTAASTTGATWVVASAVVRRQENAKQAISVRQSVRAKLGEITYGPELYLVRRMSSGGDSVPDVFYLAYKECTELMELAVRLPRHQRALVKRYCSFIYGDPIVSVSGRFPSGPPGVEAIWNKISYIIQLPGRKISTTIEKGELLTLAFGRDVSAVLPREDEGDVLRDAPCRGYLNIFRMTNSEEAKAWENANALRQAAAYAVKFLTEETRRLSLGSFIVSTFWRRRMYRRILES